MSWLYRRPWGVSIHALILLGFWSSLAGAPTRADDVRPTQSANDFQRITGDDPKAESWETLPAQSISAVQAEPAPLLKQNLKHLPDKKTGLALDIGMGSGRNAVFLAQQGFRVEGVDISAQAIARAKRLAKAKGVRIRAIQADINAFAMKPDAYDVILNIDLLERAIIPKLKKAVRRGGVVFFENLTVEQLANEHRKDPRRDLLLAAGELKEMFKDFQILYYREENDGKVAKARLIARRH